MDECKNRAPVSPEWEALVQQVSDFEKWAVSSGYDVEIVEGSYNDADTDAAFEGYQGRQTEIDALKAEISDLLIHSQPEFDRILAERQEEIAALKAEIVRYREALIPQEALIRAQGELQMKAGAHQLENAALRAENEKLREADQEVEVALGYLAEAITSSDTKGE